MRYLTAILGAVVVAAIIAKFAGIPAANWVVAQQTFESPIDADQMHMWVFLGSLLFGLVVGWVMGWGLGRRLERKPLDI